METIRKTMLKKQLEKLLFGKTDDTSISEVWIIDGTTRTRKLYAKFPNDKNKIDVLADSKDTAKTFLELRTK